MSPALWQIFQEFQPSISLCCALEIQCHHVMLECPLTFARSKRIDLPSVPSGGNLFFLHCLVGLGDLVRNKIAISRDSGHCLRDKGKS